MNKLLSMLMAAALFTPCHAKKVKLTIDGTLSPVQTKLYLIVNEDIANAQLVPINDAKFSVTIEVDRNAFVRLHDWKEWPENSPFVLIPDSRHITINWNTGEIEGSVLSKKLKKALDEIKMHSPEGFHVDVFGDDPEAWRSAQEQGNSIRDMMLQQQKDVARETILDNKKSFMCAWIVYCFPQLMEGELEMMLDHMKPKWMNHPILKAKQKKD